MEGFRFYFISTGMIFWSQSSTAPFQNY